METMSKMKASICDSCKNTLLVKYFDKPEFDKETGIQTKGNELKEHSTNICIWLDFDNDFSHQDLGFKNKLSSKIIVECNKYQP
jgi:hypothetical protein